MLNQNLAAVEVEVGGLPSAKELGLEEGDAETTPETQDPQEIAEHAQATVVKDTRTQIIAKMSNENGLPGTKVLGLAEGDAKTTPETQDPQDIVEDAQATVVKGGETEIVDMKMTDEKLLDKLLAQMDALSDKVVQIEEKMKKLSNIVECFGETQRKLLGRVSKKQYSTIKAPLKRKGYTNTIV